MRETAWSRPHHRWFGAVRSRSPDRFGLSWQIVARRLMKLLGDPDPAGASRAREAMLTMGKIDVAALEAAYAGRG
jgi:predicted 3-demethylubiquinone-9 3-methyltransferase (glyoxalase superfamily)